jgi:hypothetical protein
VKYKTTLTPTGENYFIYHHPPCRTWLLDTFEGMNDAHTYAKDESIARSPDVVSVVNANGVCVGKYRNGKYYI